MTGPRDFLPPDWTAVAPLLDQVLDAAPEARNALIAQLAGDDPARAAMLAHLVAECARETPLLDRPAAERFDGLSAEPAQLLPGTLAGRYEIGREIGRGGMACVYLARDTKHSREVAIKVIRQELSMSLAHERFLREIEIAARLRHPNIVPLYDSGEVDGMLYFVMPYEEGRSLGERLEKEGALPLADALGVLRDVGRALAYAHEHGVVHRDVKPDNVMLSGGAAVVTDFGIAKAVTAALGEVEGATLTQTGSSVGTPAYIAPEQATGDPSTDHRADIYSFGCLAFAVLTGDPPFPGRTSHQVIASHLTEVPPRVTDLRPELPVAVAALVAQCLEKNPAARPQSAREILGALDGTALADRRSLSDVSVLAPEPVSPPASPIRSRRAWGLLAAAAVLAIAVVLYAGREGADPAPLSPAAPASLTIAVLPFYDLDRDSTLAFVADGFYDEVASALARVPGIVIKSRSGARAYRDSLAVDVVAAGSKLKADYVLTAEVRQDRGRWILSADLGRQSDAASVWAQSFVLLPDQQASAAEMIADSLASALRAQFPGTIGSAPELAANQSTTSSEAYTLYLRGQERLSRRGLSVRESADLFRQAIALDTLFAPAYSGLSMSLALFPYFQGVPASTIRDEVFAAAQRALQLDSTQAQPHIAQGVVYQFVYRWDLALREYQTAVRLEPLNVEARVQLARHFLFRGRPEDALAQLRVAEAQDPESALVLSWLSYAFFTNGMIDSALGESRHALETDPANMTTLSLGSLVHLWGDRPAQARDLAMRLSGVMFHTTFVIARLDTAEARRRLRQEDAQVPQPWMSETRRAHSHLGLGDTAAALAAFERATDAGEIWSSLWPVSDPTYDPIRESPRFRAILRRVGLGDVRWPARRELPPR
ncbi:MAG TPA: protein kinase [Gemmatimonadales bacterium]